VFQKVCNEMLLPGTDAENINLLFTIRFQHSLMRISRRTTHSDLRSLEAAAAVARSGFACIFSSSDEYERALITERRARGRYSARQGSWTMTALILLALSVTGAVIYWV
jgi:hypothetical protein